MNEPTTKTKFLLSSSRLDYRLTRVSLTQIKSQKKLQTLTTTKLYLIVQNHTLISKTLHTCTMLYTTLQNSTLLYKSFKQRHDKPIHNFIKPKSLQNITHLDTALHNLYKMKTYTTFTNSTKHLAKLYQFYKLYKQMCVQYFTQLYNNSTTLYTTWKKQN